MTRRVDRPPSGKLPLPPLRSAADHRRALDALEQATLKSIAGQHARLLRAVANQRGLMEQVLKVSYRLLVKGQAASVNPAGRSKSGGGTAPRSRVVAKRAAAAKADRAAGHGEAELPDFIGMMSSGRGDLSEKVKDIVRGQGTTDE